MPGAGKGSGPSTNGGAQPSDRRNVVPLPALSHPALKVQPGAGLLLRPSWLRRPRVQAARKVTHVPRRWAAPSCMKVAAFVMLGVGRVGGDRGWKRRRGGRPGFMREGMALQACTDSQQTRLSFCCLDHL